MAEIGLSARFGVDGMMKRLKRQLPPNGNEEVGNEKISLPIYVAYCGIVRHLRYLHRTNSRFIALLKLPDGADIQSYEFAARLFLRKANTSKSHWEHDDLVRVFSSNEAMADFETKFSRNRSWLHAIFLIASNVQIPEELQLAADLSGDVSLPVEAHFVGASRRILKYSPSPDEIDFLMSEPFPRLRAAFRNGGSFQDGLRRLKIPVFVPMLKTAPIEAPKSKGPTLEALFGYGDAKRWGLELAQDIADWRMGKVSWGDVDRGALLSGPPGTGKTMYAAALARTSKIPLIIGYAGKWQEAGYLNAMLKSMAGCFAEAAERAPCLLFIDEIDAIGSRENYADHNSDYTRQVISRFLTLVDELSENGGVVLLGACNYPHLLDPAIKRPGRFDRHFKIPLPDADARAGIFEHHSGCALNGADMPDFIARSVGMSGAEIEHLVREAKRDARRKSCDFTASDVIRRLPAMVKLSDHALRSAAIHELGHAIVALQIPFLSLEAVRISDELLRSGNPEIAGSAAISIDEHAIRDRQYYLDLIAVDLAGIAAEALVLGSYADGAGGDQHADLVRASHRATLAEGVYGFGERLTSIPSRDEKSLRELRVRDPSLDRDVQKVLRKQFERATEMLRGSRASIDELVDQLVKLKYLSAGTIIDVFDKHGGKIANPPGWLGVRNPRLPSELPVLGGCRPRSRSVGLMATR